MRAAGLRGIPREKTRKTTVGDGAETPRPADMVNRQFVAAAPNQLWVADLTYIRTFAGWVYAAFVLDVYSRRDRGLAGLDQPAHRPRPGRPRDGAVGPRGAPGKTPPGWSITRDRGVQYRAVRYTERLAEAEAVASVGSKGDCYDNAMAEALNSLFKAECIRNPVLRGAAGGASTTSSSPSPTYIDWYNHRRLHGEIGHVPPAEYETTYWANTMINNYPDNESSPRQEPTNRASTEPGAIRRPP